VDEPLDLLANTADTRLARVKTSLSDGFLQRFPLVAAQLDPGQALLDQLVETFDGNPDANVKVGVHSGCPTAAASVNEEVVAQVPGPPCLLPQTLPKSNGYLLKLLLGHPLRGPLFREDPVVIVPSPIRFRDCLRHVRWFAIRTV